MIERDLTEAGALRPEPVVAFRSDVSRLLYPSRERALDLDKAYREIVREQSYVDGREATILPQRNVHREVVQGQPTGVDHPVRPGIGDKGKSVSSILARLTRKEP